MRRSPASPRPVVRVMVVVLLALVGLPLRPSIARAEGGLEIAAKSTYTVDPGAGLLNVDIEYTLTNMKPNTRSGYVITRYYYDRYALVVPDEAIDLRATNQYGAIRVDDEVMELEDGSEGRVATIHMGSIFYRQSRTFTFSFSLQGSEPRSDSGVRVNPAYTAFFAGAFGDPRLSDVEIRLPADFEVATYGDFLERSDTDTEIVLSEDNITNPFEWGVFVTGRRDDALDSTVVGLGGLEVEVKAWPGDDLWAGRVADVVRAGMPELQNLVGLDYHVDSLQFLEALDPLLVGYAGWYLVGEDRIEMGEYLDDHVILHELAHLWFNQDLFIDRWINEGLADTFAAEAVILIDGDSDDAYGRASRPIRSLSIAVPLNDWDLPRAADTDDDEAARREEYGYNASFYVIKQLFEELGAEGMSLVLNSAISDLVAYQGGGEPETVDPTDSWRRFLDLLEEVAGSEQADQLFREYVVADRDIGRLDDRASAREAFHAHQDVAGAWDTPWVVRGPMADWEFDDALAVIAAADAVIALRDDLDELAAELGLAPPASLETAYEGARQSEDLDAAATLGQSHLEALEHVAVAREAVDEPRGFFARIGLMGQDPEMEWSEAASLFEAEELDAAHTEAQQAVDLIEAAERVGQQRVLWAGVGFVGFAGATGGGTWWFLRRRRRRRSASDPAGDGEPSMQAGEPNGDAPPID